MKRRIAYAFPLALLLWACLPALAVPGEPGVEAPRAPLVASAPPPPPQPLEDPALTALVRMIRAEPDFSGNVRPGQLFNVRLVLPPGLSGSAPSAASPGQAAQAIIVPQFTNVRLQVRWSVFESAGGSLGTQLAEGQDFRRPSSTGLASDFVLAPLHVVEYRAAEPPASFYIVVASVTATADKQVLGVPTPSTVSVKSAEVPVQAPLGLLALEVPKVFVLFLDRDFGRAAAIYLPKATAFQGPGDGAQKQLFDGAASLLSTYRESRDRLSFVAWFGSYLTGLEELRKVDKLPHVDVKERKDAEKNLNDDDFIHRSWWHFNDTEVEDESSSLLLLGPPGAGARFFQDRKFKGGEFDVLVGAPREGGADKPRPDYAPAVLVRDFNAVETSEPAGKVTVVKKYTKGGKEKTPNDRASSFKWVL